MSGYVPDLPLSTANACISVPILTRRTTATVQVGIPNLRSRASVDTVGAIPSEASLTRYTSRPIFVCVGGTRRHTLPQVANRVALALPARTSNQEEISISHILDGIGRTKR